jgi:hypothetical protein
VTGRFREQFDIASPTVHEDFDYPRSTRVYLVPEGLAAPDGDLRDGPVSAFSEVIARGLVSLDLWNSKVHVAI